MMNTKLVYVLTCSEKGSYIEQALMSIWSARYHNPDAHIVLLTDNLTNLLLLDTRGKLTDYITEKIVVPFEDDGLSMMYRSRWIKTSVRDLIKGDFLFIDCDTIVCKSLAEVDSFECEVGAVLESHLLVEDFCDELKKTAFESTQRIGVDLTVEKEYFSSGVIYVKDSLNAHSLYGFWHKYWIDCFLSGLPIDQPSLSKANRELDHIIQRIPDTFNCILFTQNAFTEKAYILHVASFRNPSFLFTEKVYRILKERGLVDWVKAFLLHPCDSFLPFDFVVQKSTIIQRFKWVHAIATTGKVIKRELPSLIEDFPMQSSARTVVLWLFHHNCFLSGAAVWMTWKRIQVLRKPYLKDNVCKK